MTGDWPRPSTVSFSSCSRPHAVASAAPYGWRTTRRAHCCACALVYRTESDVCHRSPHVATRRKWREVAPRPQTASFGDIIVKIRRWTSSGSLASGASEPASAGQAPRRLSTPAEFVMFRKTLSAEDVSVAQSRATDWRAMLMGDAP
jgi:hypothetical protein